MGNPASNYGRLSRILTPTPWGTGRTFYLCSASSTLQPDYQNQFPADNDDQSGNIGRVFTSWTAAAAACISGRGDIIVMSPDFTTAPTAAELLSMESKGVVTFVGGKTGADGVTIEKRATATLPQATHASIFTVTGRVRVLRVLGTVTTVLPATANATKLVAYPTAAGLANTDLCATLDITADAVGTVYSITGTLANALVGASSGAAVAQAASLVVEAGAIHLDCAGSMTTGSIKWHIDYVALDPGARIVAA